MEDKPSARRDDGAHEDEQKSVEELFRKTKTQPAIFWKPLSDDDLARLRKARA